MDLNLNSMLEFGFGLLFGVLGVLRRGIAYWTDINRSGTCKAMRSDSLYSAMIRPDLEYSLTN